MGPIISNDNDARGRPSMEAIPEGEGDLYQSFAKLIQELDSGTAVAAPAAVTVLHCTMRLRPIP